MYTEKTRLCRSELDELIPRLPSKMQCDYVLCESTDDILEKAAKLLSRNKAGLKRQVFRSVTTKNYQKERRTLLNAVGYKPKPRESVSKTPTIIGLSTKPILLNSGEATTVGLVIFTYLHEAAHLLGLRRKEPDFLSETIADRIAWGLYTKLYKVIKLHLTIETPPAGSHPPAAV